MYIQRLNESQWAGAEQSIRSILSHPSMLQRKAATHHIGVMLKQTILTFALLAFSRQAIAVSVDTRTLDVIYQAAQHENGVLNVYFGGSCKLNGTVSLSA